MILCLDTSSLVKHYLDEEHSSQVKEWISVADGVATSVVSYPEAVSALARRCRDGDISTSRLSLFLQDLAHDWGRYLVLGVTERLAARLAVRHLLRGFDAVHLASAVTLRDALGHEGVAFSSFDEELNRAAVSEGLIVLEPGN